MRFNGENVYVIHIHVMVILYQFTEIHVHGKTVSVMR